MAVSSLSRMTVPLIGPGTDQSQSNQGLLMPKLKYRFRVTFQNFGVGQAVTELTKQVVDFTRPSVEFAEIALPIYNSTVKLAGKYTWADAVCNLRDDASGAVSRLVGEQLQKQLDFYEMASAASGIDYKFLTVLEVLDGGNGAAGPTVLETWELYGCYLKSVNYNDMNYGTSEAVTVTMNITFDNAAQVTNGGGVGYAGLIGRTVGDVASGVGV
jgi:hypothetical protein